MLVKPANEPEAIALRNLLADHDIRAFIHSFHDTAYDGLYQAQYGWGVIKVREEDFAEAQELVESWKRNAPELPDE